MNIIKIKNFLSEKKDKILFTASVTAASVLTPVVAFAADETYDHSLS